MKDVMILTGAGQIGMAIARRIGCGKKIVIGDKSRKNAEAIAATMEQAGFDLESSAHAPLVRVGLADVNLSQKLCYCRSCVYNVK